MRVSHLALACLAGAALVAIASVAHAEGVAVTDSTAVNDPLEHTNRGVFDFNQRLDKHIVRPVAVFYNHAVPGIARRIVHNALETSWKPVVFANDLLQGNWRGAKETFERTGVNLISSAGLADAATHAGIPNHDADFGQTLGVWGAPCGVYVVLPLLGSSDPRTFVGDAVDAYGDPVGRIRFQGSSTLALVRTGTTFLDLRAENVAALDGIERNSVDYYASMRSITRQRHQCEKGAAAPPM